MSRRILILYIAETGAGHLRAAQAVKSALLQRDAECAIELVNVLDFSGTTFRSLYRRVRTDLLSGAPQVLGYLYDQFDRPVQEDSFVARMLLAWEKFQLSRFLKFLQSDRWDLIINTHFLPAELIAHLRRTGRLDTPQWTIVTDFQPHAVWIRRPCERFFVANPESAAYLRSFGVPDHDITCSGIPIEPAFAQPIDRDRCRARWHLDGDSPVVLVMGGGFGLGGQVELCEQLLTVKTPLRILAVAGRNARVARDLRQLDVPAQHALRVLGYTQRMHRLLPAADLVVSKPGGLTTSEVLACGVPMVVINPTPGQECQNSDYLLEHGAAVRAQHLVTLPFKVQSLLDDPDRLASMRGAARQLARPHAASAVARLALDQHAPLAAG